MNPEPRSFRIRRCNGNRDAWLLTWLRADGTESESYGSWRTAMSLDSLLKDTRSPALRPGDRVELVL